MRTSGEISPQHSQPDDPVLQIAQPSKATPGCKAEGRQLDHLLGYETTLERNFDRTLAKSNACSGCAWVNRGVAIAISPVSRQIAQPSTPGCEAEGLQLDHLLRYEASLERNFDRVLTQLERLHQMRKGQAVPATVNANLSAS